MELNKIYQGHVLNILKTFPGECVNMCVTSPPYWGLRDYGTEPQIWDGDPICDHNFQETINPGGNGDGISFRRDKLAGIKRVDRRQPGFCRKCEAWKGSLGLEPTIDLYIKHIVQIFDEIKRVLQKDGTLWLNLGDSYVGSWGANGYDPKTANCAKRYGTTQRPPTSYPQKDLKPKDLCGIPWRVAFALQAAGWWLRQDIIWSKPNPMPESVTDRCTKSHECLFLLSKSRKYYYDAEAIKENAKDPESYLTGRRKRTGGMRENEYVDKYLRQNLRLIKEGRLFEKVNKRSVWEITIQSFRDAHFATFPEALVEPCIRASCPENGIVLDPFMGSGTTALVAMKLLRQFIGVELNPKYIRMAERRLKNKMSLFIGNNL